MISKKIISDIRALHLVKNRKEQNLFIAEGEKVVGELLDSQLKIKLIAGLPEFSISEALQGNYFDYHEISSEELLKISQLQTPNRVLAVAEIPQPTPFDFSQKDPVVLLLDGIRDPGNMGTILRTADWFGVQHIFCSDDCVDVYNSKVVQSAMGSLFRMNIHSCSLEELIVEAKTSSNFHVLGAAVGGKNYSEIKQAKPLMLVIGSEAKGISEPIKGYLDEICEIPRAQQSKAESLNAAVASAILLAHFHSL